MCVFQVILGADSSLGRVDYSSFSDQALVELLIDSFDDETKATLQSHDGMYLDVCKWSCIMCDGDDRVIEINIDSRHVSGLLQLFYAPPKVKMLKVRGTIFHRNKVTGILDLAHLPEGMLSLFLENNRLTGEIDLEHLPVGMNFLNLSHNELTGEINLTHLPHEIYSLSLKYNQFTGEIDLTQLPGGMCILYLGDNEFTGEVDLTQLPDGMQSLILRSNQITGSLIIKNLPPSMGLIDVQRNQFNPIAVVELSMHTTLELEESGVTSVFNENW